MFEVINAKFIIVALIFILFDIITGVISAFITGTFKSAIMREGGAHKLMLISVIAFGVLLDVSQYMVDLGFQIPATTAICGYITLMEIMSCIENINRGFPNALPKALINALSHGAEEYGVETEKEDSEE